MNSRSGLVAALATLTLAAGIESASALDESAERIEQLQSYSVTQLYLELDAVRSVDPDSPLVGVITSRLVALGTPENPVDDDVPY